jgi:hypothetical protein
VAKLPRVFLHREDIGDEEVKEINVQMHVEDNNVLRIDLPEYHATPKLGDASEIEAVRVHIRKTKEVLVYAFYADPMKTVINACCTGSGCTCYASGCYC